MASARGSLILEKRCEDARTKRKTERSRAGAFCLLLFILSFSFSALALANRLICRPVANYTATVENKGYSLYYSYRTFTRSHYVELSAWGKQEDKNDLSVPYSAYRSAAVGDVLHIRQEHGALGIDWYDLSLENKA